MEYYFPQTNWNCPYCGNPKKVEIKRYQNGVMISESIEEPFNYNKHDPEIIAKVFCSNCGLLFHESTI